MTPEALATATGTLSAYSRADGYPLSRRVYSRSLPCKTSAFARTVRSASREKIFRIFSPSARLGILFITVSQGPSQTIKSEFISGGGFGGRFSAVDFRLGFFFEKSHLKLHF